MARLSRHIQELHLAAEDGDNVKRVSVIHLQCTQPVLKYLDCDPKEISRAGSTDALLGNWSVTDFWVNRRHVFIFMSDKSLLSFLLLEGKMKFELADLQVLLINSLAQLLEFLVIPQVSIDTAIADLEVMVFTKTKDRSILGNLTALVDAYRDGIYRRGGLKAFNMTELILNVNNRPQRRLGWATPSEIIHELLVKAGRNELL
jgi:hypothetical protein